MKKKRILYLSIVVLCVIVAYWWMSTTPRINKETYKLIVNGMSRSEVEAIFRAPPGDHGSPKYDGDLEPDTWYGDQFVVKIYFSPEDKVAGTRVFSIARAGEKTWLQKIGDLFDSLFSRSRIVE
jgi:hypothetical protein